MVYGRVLIYSWRNEISIRKRLQYQVSTVNPEVAWPIPISSSFYVSTLASHVSWINRQTRLSFISSYFHNYKFFLYLFFFHIKLNTSDYIIITYKLLDFLFHLRDFYKDLFLFIQKMSVLPIFYFYNFSK